MNTTQKIQKNQIAYIHKLLPQSVCMNAQEKARKVAYYSVDSKEHVNQLTFQEANAMIKDLGGKPVKYQNWAFYDPNNAAHRAIMSACYELEWSFFNKDRNKQQVDQVRLSEWLKSEKSPVQKPIMRMTKEEVSKIISALRSMVSKRYEKA